MPHPKASVPTSLAGPLATPNGHASEFGGLPAVGAVFSASDTSLSHHFCTASVVDSPGGDVIVLAAHCLSDPANGSPTPGPIAFVPGYHDGQQPFGVWYSSALLIDPHWAANSDPDTDVAFAVVHKNGDPSARVEDEVGAEKIAFNQPMPATVGVVGYPAETDKPVSCLNTTKIFSPTQAEFDCTGFTDGTSGGPLLRDIDPVSGLGTVLGVIGGYQEGGDTDDVSYAAYFGAPAKALYQAASAAGAVTPSPSRS
ncbi:serine protease [Streptacidiphilus sp. BW17]